MDSYQREKIELLQDIRLVTDAIDAEIDWFLIYLFEKDMEQKDYFYKVYLKKSETTLKIAKEQIKKYERFNTTDKK